MSYDGWSQDRKDRIEECPYYGMLSQARKDRIKELAYYVKRYENHIRTGFNPSYHKDCENRIIFYENEIDDLLCR
jgi:hypothetical protein